MDDIRKERLIIAIITLAAASCIVQNYFGNWEFWVPWVVLAGDIVLWVLHITQKLSAKARIYIYFAFAAFMLFYHGIHDTSLFDISVSVVLFMVTFTITDRIRLLNLILMEYAVVMGVQFGFLYRDKTTDLQAFDIMRVVYHIVTVLTLYVFSRITISRRVAERERLDKWKDSVMENDRDMEDFLSNISHEFRTPVNVISGMTSLLQKNGDNEELHSIQSAGIRLAYHIEDIQDYTEIKRGELVLEEENYMCISLINDVVAEYKAGDQKKNLELVIDLDPQTPSYLYGDIKKIHKLFRHLMDNAIKFTRRGGIYIRVYSVPQEYGANLIIEVTDTGVGMTRADMSQVSKGLYQANKKRNRSTGGIGIGLPIVYGFVHKMSGFVMIWSKKGRGTTVHISIPQKVVDPAPCLAVGQEHTGDVVFYVKQEKYKVPEVREFYKAMSVNLARGLSKKLYSAGEKRELEHLINDLDIKYIFTGQEEYEEEGAMLEYLADQGYQVVVSAETGFQPTGGKGVIVMPKPLYGFPVVRILNGEISAENYKDPEKEKLRFDGVRALVVDDEPMNLVVASGLLRDYKMIVDTAESGKEAIAKYENGEYDVIFMDHMMPEMDGVEAMKRIRQVADVSLRHPLIVALTANALSGAREMFIREGFDGFIAKPIDIGEFERVMKRVLPEEMIISEERRKQA